jgi:peptide/nickel transport system substrate-binding protein
MAALRGLTVLVCLGLTACGGGGEQGPEQPRASRQGGTLFLDAPQIVEVQSLDPLVATNINASSIGEAIFEGLLAYTPESPNHPTAALAESWEVSDDRLVWTFRLRPGVRFHDDPCFPDGRGRAVVADDVRYSVLRSLRGGGETVPLGLTHFSDEGGARPGTTALEVLDEGTLRFTLARASNAFPHALASSVGWVVPREAVEYYGTDFGRNPVGTGPFRLAGWNSAALVLVRNDHYWRTDEAGEHLPYLEAIEMRHSGPTSRRQPMLSYLLDGTIHVLYYTGETDWPEPDRLAEFMHERGIRTLEIPKLNTIFYGWNMARDNVWTRHPDLRRAIRAAIRSPASGELVLPATGLLPPGLPDCDDTSPPTGPDPEQARELLAKAGFPDARGLPPLHMTSLGFTEYLAHSVIEPIEALGITVEFNVNQWSLHWLAVSRGDHEFFRDGWIADYPDAENFFMLFNTGSTHNNTRYSDPEYDRLFEAFRTESPDSRRRTELCRRLESILRRDVPAIFLYHERAFYLVRPEVRGWDASVNSFERRFYAYVWLERTQS